VTQDGDIWAYDVASGRGSRLTTDGVSELRVWDPTSARGLFVRQKWKHRGLGHRIQWERSTTPADRPRGAGSRRFVVTRRTDAQSSSPWQGWCCEHPLASCGWRRAEASSASRKRDRRRCAFSRDGHYVAYDSAQTGKWEVYIRSYPERSSQMTVSVGGGTEPVWAQNGDIFYRSLTRERMFAVGYDGAQTESRNTGATISRVLLRLPIRFPYPAIRCLG
jgi:hypothetical protein